ncbi:M23 family metallopeptidase [Promicromonospora sp. NPDC052451]|uniref:M23 family metallopeptidase n=1 Tax=Promicromonospora sp. NPDC052451 TaxID=3364407 RepID=UPI0037CCB839
MELVRRRVGVALGVVLAMVASFLVVASTAVPAQALGDKCPGTQVKRCIRVLQVGTSYYAHAGIEDENGAYDVAVNSIQLQRHNGSTWVTVKENGNFDGWAATRDEGDTGSHSCTSGGHSFRARAFFQWSGPDSGEQWLTTDVVPICAGAFQVPFPCSETWTGSTRSGHSPANAVDFNRNPDEGQQVYASAGGTVTTVRDLGGVSYGRYVVITHNGGYQTLYAHLESFAVSVGDAVTVRTPIGRVGSTGGSSGPHLHYEQRLNGNDVRVRFVNADPVYYGDRNLSRDSECL